MTAPVASNTGASNFTATGQLIVPMEVNTDTTDDATDIRTVVDATTNTVADIRTDSRECQNCGGRR